MLIVITDGASNAGTSTIMAATDIKNAGAEVVAVGIGRGVNETKLNIIASDITHVYRPSNFEVNELAQITDTISNRSCAGEQFCVCVYMYMCVCVCVCVCVCYSILSLHRTSM